MNNIEDFLIEITLPAFLCGLIFIATAIIMYLFPPKKINGLYGYRTSASMQSQERWDFAQRFSTLQMGKAGFVLVMVSVIGYFIPISEDIKIIIGIGLLIVACLYMMLTTEKAIKKEYPEQKNNNHVN